MKEVIIVEELVKKYGKVYALKGISFRVYEGEVFGLLGPNGAGKTTTIKAIGGALKPTRGKVYVKGLDSYKNSIEVKKIIGVVPELPSLYPELSVKENLLILSRFYDLSMDDFQSNLKWITETLELKEVLHLKYGVLSKGFKRRVDIAAALIHDPEILLLDEPTAGLDVFSANSLRKLILKLASMGKTIVLSSHYIDEVMEFSNRVILLYNGVKVYLGEPNDLRKILKLGKMVKIITSKSLNKNIVKLLEKKINNAGVGEFRAIRDKTIEIYAVDTISVIDIARDVLSSLGIQIIDIDVVPPSWEDIFMQYIELFQRRDKCIGCPLTQHGCS